MAGDCQEAEYERVDTDLYLTSPHKTPAVRKEKTECKGIESSPTTSPKHLVPAPLSTPGVTNQDSETLYEPV